MKTIVVADALMGIDNVLGVAGAAHGAIDLVIIGLLVSVPIVVFGSKIVLRLVERFPVIIQLGAAVLAFTAAKMIVGEPLLDAVFDPPHMGNAIARWSTYAAVRGRRAGRRLVGLPGRAAATRQRRLSPAAGERMDKVIVYLDDPAYARQQMPARGRWARRTGCWWPARRA
jgi:hypothetical protein